MNNPDLLSLEDLLTNTKPQDTTFNLFEVLSIWWLEDKHSRILSWLLEPQDTHCLGDTFLRRFLMASGLSICNANKEWSNTAIHREWRAEVDDVSGRLDILAVNRTRGFVCAIENKVFAPESHGQLSHYRRALEADFPDYDRHYIFLSPTGMHSHLEEERRFWQPMCYSTILQLVEETVDDHGVEMGEDVRSFLRQYATTLRRYIVPEPNEIAELARKIYEEHREAIELINRHKPHYGAAINQFLQETIGEQQNWSLDDTNAKYVRFYPTKWEEFRCFRTGTGWRSKAAILFEFLCKPDNADFSLVIASGHEDLRSALFETVKENGTVFNKARGTLKESYHHVHRINNIVDDSHLSNWHDTDGLGSAQLRQYLADFAQNECLAMNELVVRCLSEYEKRTATAGVPLHR